MKKYFILFVLLAVRMTAAAQDWEYDMTAMIPSVRIVCSRLLSLNRATVACGATMIRGL